MSEITCSELRDFINNLSSVLLDLENIHKKLDKITANHELLKTDMNQLRVELTTVKQLAESTINEAVIQAWKNKCLEFKEE